MFGATAGAPVCVAPPPLPPASTWPSTSSRGSLAPPTQLPSPRSIVVLGGARAGVGGIEVCSSSGLSSRPRATPPPPRGRGGGPAQQLAGSLFPTPGPPSTFMGHHRLDEGNVVGDGGMMQPAAFLVAEGWIPLAPVGEALGFDSLLSFVGRLRSGDTATRVASTHRRSPAVVAKS